MAYLSLYRKYRPQTFEDVVGQDHVTRTIANAIAEGRLHHAYLFTGPHGTGKTSTARILAKAVNCEQGPTPTPCNACEACTAITQGSSVDVIELDMASHGGVDDARDLRERARFAPANARRKIYILDEVHMASTAAFNALLKLIEEPPDHVIFAMATTDPQRVLPTIMSRVQRFDLRRIAARDLAAHVREICEAEGHDIDEEALGGIVRAGDGSVRDSLSVLEQVLSFAGPEADSGQITGGDVRAVLGHTPFERTAAAVDAIVDGDLAAALGLVQSLQDEGIELRRFAFDLLDHLRDLLVLGAVPERPDLVEATDQRRGALAEQAERVPRETLLHAVDVLADTVTEMRQGPPRLPLELALAGLANPSTSGDLQALADRVARLEVDLRDPAQAAGGQAPSSDSAAPEQAEHAPSDGAAPEEAAREEAAPEPAPPREAAPEPQPAADTRARAGGLEAVEEHWEAILAAVKDTSRRVHAVYEPAEPVKVRNGVLTLRYPERFGSFHADNAGKGQFSTPLAQAIEDVTGLRLRVDAVVAGEQTRPRPPLVGAAAEGEPGAGPPGGAERPDDAPAAEPDGEAATDPDRGADTDGGAVEPGADEEPMDRAERLITGELDGVRLDDT